MSEYLTTGADLPIAHIFLSLSGYSDKPWQGPETFLPERSQIV